MSSHIIYPDFFPGYHCKCGACRRTCCMGDWEIGLTKEEYLADTAPTLGPELLAMAEKGMAVNAGQTDEEHYAEMVIGENKRCVFLTEEGLCAWQLRAKASVGSVCRDFPRLYIRFLEDTYIFPSVTCEAVLELMLNKKDPIRLRREEKDLENRRCYAKVEEAQTRKRPLLRLYPMIMQYGLELLQNRSYTLDERMQLMALVVYTIDQMERSGAVQEIPAMLRQLTTGQRANQYLKMFSSYYGGTQALLLVCGDIYSLYAGKEQYQSTARAILQGLGIGLTDTNEAHLLDRETYGKNKERCKEQRKETEYFLEHIMVSIFLYNLVPMGEPGAWENFQYISACYALIKGGIIGTYDTISNDEALIDLIVKIMRMCSHNNALYGRILERFKEVKLDSLPAIVALLAG